MVCKEETSELWPLEEIFAMVLRSRFCEHFNPWRCRILLRLSVRCLQTHISIEIQGHGILHRLLHHSHCRRCLIRGCDHGPLGRLGCCEWVVMHQTISLGAMLLAMTWTSHRWVLEFRHACVFTKHWIRHQVRHVWILKLSLGWLNFYSNFLG